MKQVMIFFSVIVLLFSCREGMPRTKDVDGAGTGRDGSDVQGTADGKKPLVFYTCSMHPQVRQEEPGKCPICGMELIPVKPGMEGEGLIVLNDRQEKLGRIGIDTVRRGGIGDAMVLTGTVTVDESRVTGINVRVAGRIEKLYYKNEGDRLRKGDRLYDLYSEPLNNAKQEYLLLLEKQAVLDHSLIDLKGLILSARNKLLLWGMSEAQIEELTTTKVNTELTSFYCPADGYITALNAHEGDYLEEGAPIMRLADLSHVWVEAQVYTSRLAEIDEKGAAQVKISGLDGVSFREPIDFVNPDIDADTRVSLLRVSILNAGGKLRPGMAAYVTAPGKRTQVRNLILPLAAVIRDKEGSLVWVKTGNHTYQGRKVLTGLEANGEVEIVSGLKEREIVVTEGAYLLNSEYIFKHGVALFATVLFANKDSLQGPQ